jgi:hypothetical protein
MLPAVVHRLLIAFANPAANCGIYFLQRHAASVLRVMLLWMIQACFIVYEFDHHP